MASRLLARYNTQPKKATTLVSKQSLEQAIEEGNALVDQLMELDAHDQRLDHLENALSFLTGILHKSSLDMQAEGASTLEDYLDDAVLPEMAQKIKQDIDMIAKMKNAGQETKAPVMASGSDNWVNDRDEDGKAKTPELAEVPRLATDKTAAPQPVPPAAPVTPAKPSADITQLNSDTLAKMQKALAGSDDLMNDKAAQAFIAAIAEELMNRPVETEHEESPAQAMPVAASFFGGLHLATAQGGSFVNDGDTGSILEDGGRTPEIGEAHADLDDNTGIKRPATEKPSKFASDMTTQKAVKTVERLAGELKTLYFEAKPITESLDTRPVREAVESIYRAHNLMGEAAKALNKQKMQEDAEEEAIAIKEKNKKASSPLFGLSIADGE